MIIGIGTDIVHIPRMTSLLEKHGDKFAERILTEKEFNAFKLQLKPANFLAKRFAAKEAVAKAMGTGFRDGLSLRHISVLNDELGKPEIQFQERGLSLKQSLNIGKTLLSLSDDHEYAIAYVMLMEA
ncbi:MAG TPA: holo-ACP synthase [Methylophaga aminisulfidivorans]|uniref:Holo-[acyl-carrier-protein] synthase n=2 Tax=root TaxID=1 RepID=A0A7C1ZQZ6_9GAMM|nr:holo-ACP synthase [Methylophaga aminisulfidivorans]HEC73545.1 holo-ACP synthase [Methylophaga aminisulfidivorans]